ncbi:hypothetical protein Syun_023174 [Stephania yunnanensis]|uniref:Uncharacterized protein n=1 Tax=Stephania yunnanensis TaxID=152371 RepID=A0AAP0FFV4_9MAGN
MSKLNMGLLSKKAITNAIIKSYGKIYEYEDFKDERKMVKIANKEKQERRKIRDETRRVLEEMSRARNDKNVEQHVNFDGTYMKESKLAFIGSIQRNQVRTLMALELVFKNQRVKYENDSKENKERKSRWKISFELMQRYNASIEFPSFLCCDLFGSYCLRAFILSIKLVCESEEDVLVKEVQIVKLRQGVHRVAEVGKGEGKENDAGAMRAPRMWLGGGVDDGGPVEGVWEVCGGGGGSG